MTRLLASFHTIVHWFTARDDFVVCDRWERMFRAGRIL